TKAAREGRLVMLGAEETLSRIMSDGQPDWNRFDQTVGALIRELQSRTLNGQVRAYGEMVGLLWNSGHSAEAERLENLWNRLLTASGISLFCAYQIDVFGKEFQTGVLDGVLCSHTHVLSAQPGSILETAVNRAIDEVLGARAESV